MLQVRPLHGSFQDAASESIREWIENLETGYYLSGTAVGKKSSATWKRAMEKWGGMLDVLVGCVGSVCNVLGLFHEFMGDKSVLMIGVKGCRLGINSGDLHSANLK